VDKTSVTEAVDYSSISSLVKPKTMPSFELSWNKIYFENAKIHDTKILDLFNINRYC